MFKDPEDLGLNPNDENISWCYDPDTDGEIYEFEEGEVIVELNRYCDYGLPEENEDCTFWCCEDCEPKDWKYLSEKPSLEIIEWGRKDSRDTCDICGEGK